jgi:hydroxymethylpyrimidine pyrophosphatase-like HAD family hydrolase
MRYHVFACDYDDTIAQNGRVDEKVLTGLGRLKSSGRKLVLVTGRELDDLLSIFPEIGLFERVVAENGAVLYRPAGREEKLLGERPPDRFIQSLKERGIHPLSVGRVIVDTRDPHEKQVLETIRQMGLELQLIFNKGAVMVLPPGVNKATGLRAALGELGLSRHNTVGIGDGENDHAFLDLCECAVAVGNAVPMIRERADWVTASDRGEGVLEIVDGLLATDLSELEPRLVRHNLLLGITKEKKEVRLSPYGRNVLVAGTSGSGKSTFATAFLEQLNGMEYQFCIIDPEGDYGNLEEAVVLGGKDSAPDLSEAVKILGAPEQNVVVNLIGIPLQDRPLFLQSFFPRLQELRTRTGRPHWVLLDEIHHLAPSTLEESPILAQDPHSMLMITVHPANVSAAILAAVDVIVAIGEAPDQVFRDFSRNLGESAPRVIPGRLEPGEAMGWYRNSGEDPFLFASLTPKAAHQRHRRKYAEGALSPERSFYFQGPEKKLNLRAQNLTFFVQLAEGVDDETWEYHLRNGDFSQWFRKGIKDEELAAAAEEVEKMEIPPRESRERVKKLIEERYTLPS